MTHETFADSIIMQADPHEDASINLARNDRHADNPLSVGQHALWFLHKLDPGTLAYHLGRAVRIRGSIDMDAFSRAFRVLVDRHEALRTTFPAVDGTPVARVNPTGAFQVSFEDLASCPAATLEARFRTLFDTPFDLEHGPLLRVAVFRLGADEHVLATVIHHIVSDGWSQDIMIAEFGKIYQGLIDRQDPEIPPAIAQASDYASWQQELLSSAGSASMREFWRDVLDCPPAPQPLAPAPVDAAMCRRQSAKAHRTLSRPLSDQVKALARNSGKTIYVTLLSAFQILMHRMTACDDFLVATPVACRKQRSHLAIVGYLANIAILRARVDPALSVGEHLDNVGDMVAGALRHQYLPYALLAREAGLTDEGGNGTAARVAFTHRKSRSRGDKDTAAFLMGEGRVRIGPFDAELIELDPPETQFDLEMATGEVNGELTVAITYDRAVLCPAVAELVFGRYTKILEQMVEAPETLIGDLEIIPDEEAALIATFTQTRTFAEYPIAHRFDEVVAQHPDAVAIIDGQRHYSYRELAHRAEAIAQTLMRKGVRPQEPVAAMLSPGFDLIAAIMGILKSGAAYLPLDCQFPEDRIAFMLEDAGARHAIVAPDFPVPAAYTGTRIDPSECRIDGKPASAMPAPTPQSLAYIIYTSGSTGRPKGVEITQGAVARLFEATADQFKFGANDCWTLFHSAAFDFSVWEIFGALLHGGRLVIVPSEARRDPACLHALLVDEGVTILNQTPSAFSQLARWDSSLPQDQRRALALRLVVFGGEALDPATLRSWFSAHDPAHCAMVNMYGITETTVHVTHHRLGHEDLDRPGSPIGRAIADLAVAVVDPRGQPVPVGAIGELIVSGPGLARAYHGRTELTSERFVCSPSHVGGRYYRSGDLVRQRLDGSLEYLGRADKQVKIRGFRIELGEIESAIAQHEGIAAALVTTWDRNGSTQLHAYYVSNGEVAIAALRESIGRLLPSYMMPVSFNRIAALPRTPSGKVDRAALPLPSTERQEQPRAYEPPRTPAEHTLADVWAEVLGVEKVGIHDRFFDIGGDSIRSLSVVSRAQAKGIGFDIKDLFEHPTIAQLAAVSTTFQADAHRVEIPVAFAMISPEDRAKLPTDVDDAYPLSALQAGMLFHSEMQPDKNIYREIFSLGINLPLQDLKMRDAIDSVVARHGALRTTFDLTRFERPLQLVRRGAKAGVEFHDLTRLEPAAQLAQLTEYRAEACRQRSNLGSLPAITFAMHRLSAEKFQFTVSFHHVILDGWSLANIISEILLRYVERDKALPAALREAAPNMFALYVAEEERATRSEQTVRFWRDNLADATFASLPKGDDIGTGAAQRIRERLGEILTQKLRDRASTLEVPLKTLLLAIHCRVMAFVTGENDLVTGMVTNGRPEIEGAEHCVGIFLNTIPMRVRVDDHHWGELIKRVYEQEKQVLRYRHLPLPDIQRLQGKSSLFEHNFTYIHMRVYNERLGEAVGRAAEHPELYEHTNHALTAVFELDLTGQLALSLRYLDSQVSHAQATRYMAYYLRALEDCAAHGDASKAACELLSHEECEELERLGAPRLECSRAWAGSLCERLWQHASMHPERTAVATTAGSVNYAELARMVDRVADALAAAGARAGDRIAIGADRRFVTVVAMLAVLKIGAAFVPLHRDEPPKRVADMARQAGVSFVLAGQPAIELPDVTFLDLDAALSPPSAAVPPHLPVQSRADALAYVMFTSGSSGKPKGVCIGHGQLMSYVNSFLDALNLDAPCHFSATGRLSWDHPYSCIFSAIAAGGTLCLPSDEEVHDPELLARFMQTQRVDVLKTSPSFLDAVLEIGEAHRLLPERLLLFGGEVLQSALVSKVLALKPTLEVRNHYGPTETTIGVAMSPRGLDSEDVPAIGTPLGHVSAIVQDESGRLVPRGSVGELLVGGPSVANGYMGKPDETADRFVERAPFGRTERFYRTGDRVCWRPDGQLAFLGRFDDQTKIRGIRIEPSEVDVVALATGLVQESATVVQTDVLGERHLHSYVVTKGDFATRHSELVEALERDRVAEWEQTHDDVYRALRADSLVEAHANTIGWNNSYDGAPFTAAEMQEYLDNYVFLIGARTGKAALEIGCGAGMVLFRLATTMREYVGVDLSQAATDHVRAVAEGNGLTNITTQHCAAHDIARFGKGRFDRVIYASVAQKFPSLRYLETTLLRAIAVAAPGARIVLSDIRDLTRLPMFHASVQLHRGADNDTARTLAMRTRRAIDQEAELAVDRAYFTGLGRLSERIKRVLVSPKRGRITNELTAFRYDVTIELDLPDGPQPLPAAVKVSQQEMGAKLERMMQTRDVAAIALPPAPDIRTSQARRASELIWREDEATAASLRRRCLQADHFSLDPGALAQLGDRFGYRLSYCDDSSAELQFLRCDRSL